MERKEQPSLGFINAYTVNTLENNWNEERFDVKHVTEHRPALYDVNIFFRLDLI